MSEPTDNRAHRQRILEDVARHLPAGQASAERRAAGLLGDESGSKPPWLDPARVVAGLDADRLLDAGRMPLPLVIEKARGLRRGELLRIDAGFRPLPLAEALEKLGFATFVREAGEHRFETYVTPDE